MTRRRTLNVENFPLVLDTILQHVSQDTLTRLARTSKAIRHQATKILYHHPRIRANELESFLNAQLKLDVNVDSMTVSGLIQGAVPDPGRTRSLKTRSLPRLGQIIWDVTSDKTGDHLEPASKHSPSPTRPFRAFALTMDALCSLDPVRLVLKGAFDVLQALYALSDIAHGLDTIKKREMILEIDPTADLTSHCPPPQWGALLAASRPGNSTILSPSDQSLISLTIIYNYHPSRETSVSPATPKVSYPAHLALFHYMAFLVELRIISLTLVNFAPFDGYGLGHDSSERFIISHQPAKGIAASNGGQRRERVEFDVRDLAFGVMQKLWAVYGISAQCEDRIRTMSLEEWVRRTESCQDGRRE